MPRIAEEGADHSQHRGCDGDQEDSGSPADRAGWGKAKEENCRRVERPHK